MAYIRGMGTRPARKRLAASVVATLGLAGLAGCSAAAEAHDAWILDDGSGPQLCQALMESYPPQCHGEPIVDWDWDAVAHEEAGGVRWGLYSVIVERDGDNVRVTLADTDE